MSNCQINHVLYSLSACLEDRHQNPPSWTQQTEQHGLGCPRPAMVLVVDLTEAQLEFESDHAWRVKFAELEDEVREVSGVSWQASCPARFVLFFLCVFLFLRLVQLEESKTPRFTWPGTQPGHGRVPDSWCSSCSSWRCQQVDAHAVP